MRCGKLITGVFLSLLLGCTVLQPNPTKNPIYWRVDRPLTWDDFKAKPVYNSGNAAISSVSLPIHIKAYPIEGANITVNAAFYPYRSWFIPKYKEDEVLTHEQYHFDIEEIFARKMRKAYATKNFTYNHHREEIWAIRDSIWELAKAYQALYDDETKHSIDVEQQELWEKRIDKELKEWEAYADPTVKITIAPRE